MTKIKKLRILLGLHVGKAIIISHGDEWQNEYLPSFSQRLKAITGFSGSAGCAIIGLHKAVLLTDGRYQTQAKNEIDQDIFEIAHSGQLSISSWIKDNIPGDEYVFLDPQCHSVREYEALSGLNLKFTNYNWADNVWDEKPNPKDNPIFDMDPQYVDLTANEKIKMICKKLTADLLILSSPESLCWLMNQRSSDIPHTPVFLKFGILSSGGKLETFSLDEFRNALPQIKGKTVSIDPSRCSIWIKDTLENNDNKVVYQEDPCLLPKACKTPSELKGMREAHKLDAIAMIEFLADLEETIKIKDFTEIESSDLLFNYRKKEKTFLDLSFATISGADVNGAIIHYHASPQTCGTITKDSVYLLDSGGQYRSGTTDITRTMAFKDTIDLDIKKAYTAVLKGVIHLSRAKFPKGTTGHRLDALARYHLWQQGLDYDHGTGHGVGCVLSVHEGPQSISSRHNPTPLQEGMIVSIEPGYYKPGHFGIRIENLAVVVNTDHDFLEFETLTLVPINQKLIHFDLLDSTEKEWLDSYHQRITQEISPFLSNRAKKILSN
jgi:Xaa-Pro aminopeptidase